MLQRHELTRAMEVVQTREIRTELIHETKVVEGREVEVVQRHGKEVVPNCDVKHARTALVLQKRENDDVHLLLVLALLKYWETEP